MAQPDDFDADGLSNGAEMALAANAVVFSTSPANADTDGDGTDDGIEAAYTYLDPLDSSDGDYDHDGLLNGDEHVRGTDLDNCDTDGDTLPDGIEVAWGTNPLVTDDMTADLDNDGLTLADEYAHGTNPSNADTDGDGASDGPEAASGGFPADSVDGGVAPATNEVVALTLTVGDHSSSESEIYELTLAGPHTTNRVHSGTPGNLETATFNVQKGASYTVTLAHVGSDPGTPEYDYTAQVSFSTNDHVVIEDPDNLLGAHGTPGVFDATFDADEKTAIIHVLKVEFIPDPGKVHHGFDPPNPDEGNPEDEPCWASVLQGEENDIINLDLGTASLANLVKCRIVTGDENYVDISSKTFTTATTKLTLTGKPDLGDDIREATIEVVLKDGGEVLNTLKVMVLPHWTIEAGFYTLEDPASTNTALCGLPSWVECINVCNDVFKQAGVSFTVHSSSGARCYPYDTRGFKDLMPATPGYVYGYDETIPLRAPDGAMTLKEWDAITQPFAENTTNGYIPPARSLFECVTLSNTLSIVIVNAGATPYEGFGAPYVRGFAGTPSAVNFRNLVTIEHLMLAITHEFGHGLLYKIEGDGHDFPPYPSAVVNDLPNGVAGVKPGLAYGGTEHLEEPEKAIMSSGSPVGGKLPWLHGRWMRHEYWELANIAAKGLSQ